MTKKFDVVIGNPPYQEEAQGGRHATPPSTTCSWTPHTRSAEGRAHHARTLPLQRGLHTPKDWNAKMLADEHLRVAYFEPDSGVLFPGLTDPIKGGIAVTYRDSEQTLGPIGFFTRHPALNEILHRVARAERHSLMAVVSAKGAYRYTDKMYEDHPDASAMIPSTVAVNIVVGFEQSSVPMALRHAERWQRLRDHARSSD